MFKRNDGKGTNAVQNIFTALLKKALHNHKIDYITSNNNRAYRVVPLENDIPIVFEEYDYIGAKLRNPNGKRSLIFDYLIVYTLKHIILTYRELHFNSKTVPMLCTVIF